MNWIEKLKDNITLKRLFILVGILAVFAIGVNAFQIVFGQKEEVNKQLLTEYFIESYMNDDWAGLYSTILLPENEQYITKEVFIQELSEQNKETVKSKDTIKDFTYESQSNEDESVTTVTAHYKKNTADKIIEFKVITDDNGNIYVSPDTFIVPDYVNVKL